jgi:pimeloyl-ACP methyl ester carboxylesterase
LNIYLISGLGADRTVFRNLRFSEAAKIHYLDWIPPKPNESLRGYALRLAEAIDTSAPFNLIGLSFGGMLATEIANTLQSQKTILISSIPTKRELPWHFHLFGRLGINKIIPAVKPKRVPRFISSVFGVESKADALFFQQLLNNTDLRFTKWAMNSILKWDRIESPAGLIRIHGDKDKVLPMVHGKVDYIIKGAGHFMVFNRADEISKILAELGAG